MRQFDPSLGSYTAQVKEGKLAHQKTFYFWLHTPDLDTDTITELLLDDFTLGKRHKEVEGISRSDPVFTIKFKEKLCYRFGKHKLGPLTVELVHKRELEPRLQELKKDKWQSKWPELKS